VARDGWAVAGHHQRRADAPQSAVGAGAAPGRGRGYRRVGPAVAALAAPHRHHIGVARGVPLRDVQDYARHRDARTTRRYDHPRDSLDRSAAYAVAAYLA
jgi:hypothetical protein